jgi:hypothetical protein
MFRNGRNRWMMAMAVVVLLLAALPAFAGDSPRAVRGSAGVEAVWDGLKARVLAWFGISWNGDSSVLATDSSSQIDPLGQPKAASGEALASPDYSAGIGPNGQY